MMIISLIIMIIIVIVIIIIVVVAVPALIGWAVGRGAGGSKNQPGDRTQKIKYIHM